MLIHTLALTLFFVLTVTNATIVTIFEKHDSSPWSSSPASPLPFYLKAAQQLESARNISSLTAAIQAAKALGWVDVAVAEARLREVQAAKSALESGNTISELEAAIQQAEQAGGLDAEVAGAKQKVADKRDAKAALEAATDIAALQAYNHLRTHASLCVYVVGYAG